MTRQSEDLRKRSNANRRYFGLTRDVTVLAAQYEPRRFAGVYFSDGYDPVEIRKTEQTKRAADNRGVVAVSGVVPLLCCCDADVGNFTRDEMFLALRPAGRAAPSRPTIARLCGRTKRTTWPDGRRNVCHNRRILAPAARRCTSVCLKPPSRRLTLQTPNGVVWGCPRRLRRSLWKRTRATCNSQ